MADGLIVGQITVSGTVQPADGALTDTHLSSGAAISRSKLALEQKKYVVPWSAFRVHDAIESLPPQPSANDDIGWPSTQTFGTVSPYLNTRDLKTLSTSLYTRFSFALPGEYAAGETVILRVRGGMSTTVSDTSCDVDAVVYEADRDGGVGSDLCATAAQSINNLANADKDFTITATSLSPGDVLDCRIEIAVVDSATATAVIAELLEVAFLLDVRG